MKNPKIKYYDVSAQCYDALLVHLSQADGCTVTRQDDNDVPTSSVTGDNTELNLTYDPQENSLLVEYAEVPVGLETYYWGHSFQRIHLISRSLAK
ncbi:MULTISPECIES: hypothetical protein [Pseudoalteromonas]|uniref:Uncharacterized protein n=1 Tax=Pseudoalteromonas rubra TaxID=43658 RepID=A0A0L0EQE9_9GAMM|nr:MULTISPECIES: hypothetical protein [Pseudoalteromonas]KNC66621.1 hypothetical protein AC626_15790 [Pseudoalteromonas rubra]MDK1311047.1 hypothetical protein [Pseudoalteromonas sp. R96]